MPLKVARRPGAGASLNSAAARQRCAGWIESSLRVSITAAVPHRRGDRLAALGGCRVLAGGKVKPAKAQCVGVGSCTGETQRSLLLG